MAGIFYLPPYPQLPTKIAAINSTTPNTVQQTITGKASIQVTTTRTQTGVARISASILANQTGIARIQAFSTQNQTGKSAIQNIATQTQVGVARITVSTQRTQTGKAAIQNITTRTQTGKANIVKPFPFTGVIDNFNRSNQDPIASGWASTPIWSGVDTAKIASNQIAFRGANAHPYWDTTYTANQEVYITLKNWASYSVASLMVRGTNLNSASPVYIFLEVNRVSGNYEINSFPYASLATGSITLASDDSIGLRAVGNQIEFWHKPSGGSWTPIRVVSDSNNTGTGKLGLLQSGGSDGLVFGDDFGGGSLDTVTTTKTQDGRANIISPVLRTQTGVARIQKTVTQTQTGKANIADMYTRGASGSLPSTNANLGTAYSSTDIADVDSDNGVRVGISGSGYILHQFKKLGPITNSSITAYWNGQSTKAPSTATVYLQIYNVNSSSWETLSSNNSASANTDFTLNGSVNTNTSNYYDSDRVVSFRVYQQI